MALIYCVECSAQVSDRAATCPRCGYPIGGRDVPFALPPQVDRLARQVAPPPQPAVVTIEKTGKSWKAGMLVFSMLFFLGIVVAVGGSGEAGGGIAVFGAVGYLAAKIGAWWHHG
jgi:hypothetical protein